MNFNILRVFLPLACVYLIFGISASYASAEQKNCRADDKIPWNYQPVNPPKDATIAPFEMEDGSERDLSYFRRLGLVVNFWATWCVPCVREMPSLSRLQSLLKDDLIQVLAIAEDRNGALPVKKFYAQNNIKNLMVVMDKNGRLMRASGVFGLPETLLINQQGKVVGRVAGAAEWDDPAIVAFLRRCLGGES